MLVPRMLSFDIPLKMCNYCSGNFDAKYTLKILITFDLKAATDELL
jgi:hypothetical protein